MNINRINEIANESPISESQSPTSNIESKEVQESIGFDPSDQVEASPQSDLINTLITHAENMIYREAVIDNGSSTESGDASSPHLSDDLKNRSRL